MSVLYAHSHPIEDAPVTEWETLEAHLDLVAKYAKIFGENLGLGKNTGVLAELSAYLHDLGKASEAFQNKLLKQSNRKVDHSTFGAKHVLKIYDDNLFSKLFAWLIAYGIAGHHAGLANGENLEERLTRKEIPQITVPQFLKDKLPSSKDLEEIVTEIVLKFYQNNQTDVALSYSFAFLGRMIFSCLSDADSLATEAYTEKAKGNSDALRGDKASYADLKTLRNKLNAHLKKFDGAKGALNQLRSDILSYACSKSSEEAGLFTLTVPTGGGKTLTSMAFALNHAIKQGMKRIIYVIPYTSIIEQTADVFRAIFGNENILEHHGNFDIEHIRSQSKNAEDEDSEASVDQVEKELLLAAENWDIPIILTTSVQFFESLYSSKRTKCRKLHNIVQSVIIFDEAQQLPVTLLRPCLSAIKELSLYYHSSAILCTATQPAVRNSDQTALAEIGLALEIPEERELAPHPVHLYEALKRTEAISETNAFEAENLAAQLLKENQVLCIVNSRRKAKEIFQAMRNQSLGEKESLFHLSTYMTADHRRNVLETIRKRLKENLSVQLVSTSLIEAGVDIDFPVVWREKAGLDSIIQAAGRCNREGKLETLGKVHIFSFSNNKYPHQIQINIQSFEAVERKNHFNLFSLEAIRDYFCQTHAHTKNVHNPFDQKAVANGLSSWFSREEDNARANKIPYRDSDENFSLIDDNARPIIVLRPETRNQVNPLLEAIRNTENFKERGSLRPLLRKLRQHMVSVPPYLYQKLEKENALEAVSHFGIGKEMPLLRGENSWYDPDFGIHAEAQNDQGGMVCI